MREASPSGADPRAVESTLRAVDFVEERLGEPIGVEDMARQAYYSPFYFSRLFAQATGHSPYDYLMRRRVAAAAEEVVGGGRSLTDIALDYGFEAPDSLSRAFRRCFGSLPSEARKAGSFPRRIARTRVVRAYVEAMLGFPPGPPTRVEMGNMVLRCDLPVRGAEARAERRGGDPLAGSFQAVLRDEGLAPLASFAGTIAAANVVGSAPEAAGARPGAAAPAESGVPEFPGTATLIRGGVFARFRVQGGEAGLEAAVEYAYRAWLPDAGAPVPGYDLVEYGGAGPAALLIPGAE